jgi:hypothetical protein
MEHLSSDVGTSRSADTMEERQNMTSWNAEEQR